MSKSKYWILMKMFLYLIKFGIFHAATCNIIVIKSIIYTTRLADLVRTRAQNNLDNCCWPWCEHYRGLVTAQPSIDGDFVCIPRILFIWEPSECPRKCVPENWVASLCLWDGLHDTRGTKFGLKCKQCDRSMWDMAHYSQDGNWKIISNAENQFPNNIAWAAWTWH